MKRGTSALDSKDNQNPVKKRKLERKCPQKMDDIQNYSINLMWLNRTLDPSWLYITPHESEEKLSKNYLRKQKNGKHLIHKQSLLFGMIVCL